MTPLRLNARQGKFTTAPKIYTAFVGGYQSGKTFIAACKLFFTLLAYPGVNVGYFAPTYPLIKKIFYRHIVNIAEMHGYRVKINKQDHIVTVYWKTLEYGKIFCVSMSNPDDIVGFSVAAVVVDEIDIMSMDKAEEAWTKIQARLSMRVSGLPNWIGVTTTPEGFHFTYQKFKKTREGDEHLYGIIHCSTTLNARNLREGYVDDLRASYPPQLVKAYLDGQFVPLRVGLVYPNFDRRLNHSDAVIEDGEHAHIGMDFNVGKMAGACHVLRGDKMIAVDELIGLRDTPEMINAIREMYWEYNGGRYSKTRRITIYPDSSGKSASSNASLSDIAMLDQAGFSTNFKPANPPIRDRVNSVNAMILNDKGERRYFVNTGRCPTITECFEQQPYDKNGMPDKDHDLDHPMDAVGHPVYTLYPVNRNIIRTGLRRAY